MDGKHVPEANSSYGLDISGGKVEKKNEMAGGNEG